MNGLILFMMFFGGTMFGFGIGMLFGAAWQRNRTP